MGFEEPVEPIPGRETEHPAQLGFGDATALEFIDCQGLKRAARQIAGNLDCGFGVLSPYFIPWTRSRKRRWRWSAAAGKLTLSPRG
jgi:hypothetical protein